MAMPFNAQNLYAEEIRRVLNDEEKALSSEARALKRQLFGVQSEWHLQTYKDGDTIRYDLQSNTFTGDVALTLSGNFLAGKDAMRDQIIQQLLTILNVHESRFSI